MRAAARLTLAFIVAFIFFLAAGTGVSVMRSWLETAQAIPPAASFPLIVKIFEAVSAAVPQAVFGALLLAIPLTVRRVSGLLITGLTLSILSGAVFFAFTYGIPIMSTAAKESNETIPVKSLGAAGLVVELPSGSIAFAGSSAVEFTEQSPLRVIPKKNADEFISRSGAIQPLGSPSEANPTINALTSDFQALARRLSASSEAGWETLLVYSCALALLLSSFCSLAGATRWPLADVALCALAFRGILIFDDIVSSGSVVRFVVNGNFGIPQRFIVPVVLGGCGLLVFIAGVIFRLARGRMERHV